MNYQMWALVALVILGYFIAKKATKKIVQRIGRERNIDSSRIQYVLSILYFVLGLLAFLVVGGIAGIGYKQFGFFLSSIVAVLGVALFAQWSILSNLTASIMVFFFFPYRVGDFIRVLDGENTVDGRIKEIALFHVILKNDEGMLVTIPNALVFQKAVVIDKKERNVAQLAEQPVQVKSPESETLSP